MTRIELISIVVLGCWIAKIIPAIVSAVLGFIISAFSNVEAADDEDEE